VELTDAEQKIVSAASRAVHREFKKLGSKVERLPIEFQTFLIVESAQGIIDNGGLQYFFESDWDGKPPYSYHCDAYERIGAVEAAAHLVAAANMFPFADPHLQRERRLSAMEELWESEDGQFAEFDFRLCGNEIIWRKLYEYVLEHSEKFKVAGKSRY